MNIKISISLFYKRKIATLRNRLLLTKSDYLFAFFQFSNSRLSSLNRSNSKAFCHILPCVALICEGMHYYKTRVPWQMNKTLIIRFFLYFQVFQPFLYSANLAYIGITWHSFVSKRCKIRCKNIAFTPRYFTR